MMMEVEDKAKELILSLGQSTSSHAHTHTHTCTHRHTHTRTLCNLLMPCALHTPLTDNQAVLERAIRSVMLVMLEEGVNSRASFASTLRLLLDEPGAPHVQEFEQFLVLLSSSDFEVQSEAQALLVLLVTKSPDLLPHVLEDLFELINTRGTADADEVCEVHHSTAAATKLLTQLANTFPTVVQSIHNARRHLVVARNLACKSYQLVRTESANLLRLLLIDPAVQEELMEAIGRDLIAAVLFDPDLIRRGFSKTTCRRLARIHTGD